MNNLPRSPKLFVPKLQRKMSDRHRELVLDSHDARQLIRRRTRRSFLAGGIAAAAGLGGYEWLTRAHEDDGAPWPQRRVLKANGKLFNALFSESRLMPAYTAAQVQFLKPNGDIGLKEPIEDWSLGVKAPSIPDLNLQLADIQALPRTELITRFCCIEGWSTVVQWAGARFSDFVSKYYPPGRALTRYIYMATPDEDYYVGLDIKSAMHPQTLLAYEQNGASLSPVHGAPLRLVIPVKYGIKNIKRIGLIEFTNKRAEDYWAEEGYDWYAGL